MARKTLQFVRGLKSKLPKLKIGEPGLCTDENLYIGTPTGNKKIPWMSEVPTEPSDINAAKSDHKHSANDITSGTLPVSRGGTGVSSLVNSSYNTNQVRGIYFSTSKPSSVPNGCICLVYI